MFVTEGQEKQSRIDHRGVDPGSVPAKARPMRRRAHQPPIGSGSGRRTLGVVGVTLGALLGALLVGAPSAGASPAVGTSPSAVTSSHVPAAGAASRSGLPAVYPVPQQMTAHGQAVALRRSVALVTGPGSDPAAVAAVRSALTSAGVVRVDAVASPATPPTGEAAVYVGGVTENPSTTDALAALGVTGASGLADEGYVLAAGTVGRTPLVVLDGKDATGTYYAAQTLRQLVTGRPGAASVPGVVVRDWPAYPLRGVIEGFYGTPWSDAARDDQLRFYGAHKMNTYVYSPKDDDYLRAKWRDAYPADQLAAIKGLVDTAVAHHVKFTYALSPGLSVCYSSTADEQALVAKFQSLWDIGVRDFAIPLDDISYTTWNCEADKARFGTGGAAAGAAQSFLLNAVQRDFVATHEGASRLQMVPTEYYDVTDSGYKSTLRAQLDPAVIVEWTGVGVIAPVFTTQQAAAARAVFGHDILVWDNYPVNDYVTDRLLLGPYVGRAKGMSSSLDGITANPMIQPEASKIALFNVADYTWNDAAYDAPSSWQASLTELSGGDPQARAALTAFADLEHSSDLGQPQAPVLAARVRDFWAAWERGESGAVGPFDRYLQTVTSAQAVLTARMGDPAFVSDAQPWLGATTAWGQASRAALQMLVDQRRGRGAAALADRALVEAQVARATTFVYVGLDGSSKPVTVGDGVVDRFVDDALAENARWLGLDGPHRVGTTSLPTYQTNSPSRMVDGDDGTWFWSSRAPKPGDTVGIDLGEAQPVTSVAFHMGKPGSTDDYVHAGALEVSTDGTTWRQVATTTAAEVSVDLPTGTTVRYLRLRATAAQTSWVVVRDITVSTPTVDQPVVSGGPAPAAGTTLGAAADGSLDTAYTAGSAPAQGDALVVTLPAARPLGRLGVVGTGSADVQVHTTGAWRPIGRLAPGYTELRAGGRTVDAVRLVWAVGSAPATIREIVPRYADEPVLRITPDPAAVELEAGGTASFSLGLASPRAADTSGRLTVNPPAGVTVKPRSLAVTLPRGARTSVPVTVTATTPGTYAVAVTYRASGSTPVTATVRVVVHPAVATTDVAASAEGGVAGASSVEQNLPQFTAEKANDGDAATRWSSGYDDAAWWQVHLATPQPLGKVVLRWESAHATDYRLEVSSDGTTWRTVGEQTASNGGTETFWLDGSDVSWVRMQGVKRATAYGYSLYALEAYPVA